MAWEIRNSGISWSSQDGPFDSPQGSPLLAFARAFLSCEPNLDDVIDDLIRQNLAFECPCDSMHIAACLLEPVKGNRWRWQQFFPTRHYIY